MDSSNQVRVERIPPSPLALLVWNDGMEVLLHASPFDSLNQARQEGGVPCAGAMHNQTPNENAKQTRHRNAKRPSIPITVHHV